MKRYFTLLLLIIFCVVTYAQQEHYDVKPKFTHYPTSEERMMLPTWYQHTRSSTPPTAPVTALAEFQPMGGVMIAYPLGIPVNLVAELSFLTKVKVLVYPASDSITAKNYFLASGVNTDNVNFWVINHDSYWTRDYGPWFIIDGNDQVGVVDFTYNRPQRPHDDAALQSVVNKMGIERYEMPIVHTGGNYMVDGYGTAASTELVLEENPNQSASSILSITHDYLGIDNYMYLDDPLGDYIEHIDCWGKFLDVDKVLIGQVPTSDSRYNDYEAVANTFANALTPWGNHYQVYRVYSPGRYNVTPFTNSLILNDHVFVPLAGSQWDNDAITVYQNAMPGYTIVPIHQSHNTPWENTDALHCRTHELADVGMLFIKHYPLLGNQDLPNTTTIETEIKALSGAALVSDSTLVFYRINNGNWQSIPLQYVSNATYQTVLPTLQANDEVDYYILAKDESGRRSMHPLIGPADPHHFTVHSVGITNRPTSEKEIVVYPNPCDNQCIIQDAHFDIRTIQVYDIFGKLIYQNAFHQDKINLNVSQWTPGVYNMVVTDANGDTYHRKIVKR
ncbi:MAG: agmatine deiminase family protein [Bacteroidales bacterium]|nr:agmatine deiminase family protein [Bacteroidales bacterium]